MNTSAHHHNTLSMSKRIRTALAFAGSLVAFTGCVGDADTPVEDGMVGDTFTSFEDFEATVYREPDTGMYIVN